MAQPANATSYGGAVGQVCGTDICAFTQTWVNTRPDTTGGVNDYEIQGISKVTCRNRHTNAMVSCYYVDMGSAVQSLYRKANVDGTGGDFLLTRGPGRLFCSFYHATVPDCPATVLQSTTAFVPIYTANYDYFSTGGAPGYPATIKPQASGPTWTGVLNSGLQSNINS